MFFAILTFLKNALLLLFLLFAACSRKDVEPTAPAAAPPPPASTVPKGPTRDAVMVTYSTTDTPVEERFSLADDVVIRYGPGEEFPEVSGAQALKGSRIYVLEEKSGWIRFRGTRESGPTVGWINRFSSTPASDLPPEALASDVQLLMSMGIVVNHDALQNSANVDTNIWNRQDLPTQKGIGRALAFYCASQKGSSTRWVEIRDSGSGRKVAKYSENMGFSSYLQKPERN